jgi:hypothetical protein
MAPDPFSTFLPISFLSRTNQMSNCALDLNLGMKGQWSHYLIQQDGKHMHSKSIYVVVLYVLRAVTSQSV